VTLFVNWLVKPFSMAAFAWLFFRYLFAAWIPTAERRSVHRRLHHPRGGALYSNGLRLEPPV
jgi:hypothetical protein